MSVYNSAALAAAMNSSINNITGGETTPEDLKGAVNLGTYIKNPRNIIINSATGRIINGLTITANNDGTITVRGTATTNTNLFIVNNAPIISANSYQELPKGVYAISGSPVGAVESKFIMSFRYGATTTGTSLMRIPAQTKVTIDNSNGTYKFIAPYISVWGGQTIDATFTPTLIKVR